MRAALLLAMFLSPTVALAGDDAWPDSPNKLWFENLQRPDNHKRPYQDKHTKSCCGPGDVVKTKFRVVRADSSYPQDAWFAWLRQEWVRIPDDKIVPDHAPDGNAYLGFASPMTRSSPTMRRTEMPTCSSCTSAASTICPHPASTK